MDGLMPYDIATGKEPINVAELRHKVAADIVAFRKDKTAKIRAALEQQKRIQEYYSGCKSIRYPKKTKGGVSDIAFIKNGYLVALAHFEPSAGGIYAADNEVQVDVIAVRFIEALVFGLRGKGNKIAEQPVPVKSHMRGGKLLARQAVKVVKRLVQSGKIFVIIFVF